ncbi:MAG: hypothetical protein OEX04_12665, partial [Acidimicrobiia bacterium]|nr:hypothetical protein [Acidimicrobiia bacterium]
MVYKGNLKVAGDPGDGIAVELSLDDVYVDLHAEGENLGRWRMDLVEVARLAGNEFSLVLDGEHMVFKASDPLGFAYNAVTTIDEISGRLRKKRKGLFRKRKPEKAMIRGALPADEKVAAPPAALLPTSEESVELPDDRYPMFTMDGEEAMPAATGLSDPEQFDASVDRTGETLESLLRLDTAEVEPVDLVDAPEPSDDLIEMELMTEDSDLEVVDSGLDLVDGEPSGEQVDVPAADDHLEIVHAEPVEVEGLTEEPAESDLVEPDYELVEQVEAVEPGENETFEEAAEESADLDAEPADVPPTVEEVEEPSEDTGMAEAEVEDAPMEVLDEAAGIEAELAREPVGTHLSDLAEAGSVEEAPEVDSAPLGDAEESTAAAAESLSATGAVEEIEVADAEPADSTGDLEAGEVEDLEGEQPVEPELVGSEVEPAEPEPVDVESVDVESVDVESVDVEPVEAESLHVESVDVEPVDVES